MMMFQPRSLEVRASADGDAADRFRWNIAIPGRWVIERSTDVFPSEREAMQAGLAVLSARSVTGDLGKPRRGRASPALRGAEFLTATVGMFRRLAE